MDRACTGIARSWVRIPFKPEFSLRLLFQLLKFIAHCEDQISLTFHVYCRYLEYSTVQNLGQHPIFTAISHYFKTKLSRAEGPLAELHTYRTMPVIFHGHG